MTPLALIISGSGIGALLLWVVGLVVCGCIVVFIMRRLGAPEIAFTVLYVALAVVLLLLSIDFFFGGADGTVIIR